jgi:hypothetical protein
MREWDQSPDQTVQGKPWRNTNDINQGALNL